MKQISFSSYVDNVAHVFQDKDVTNLCKLIDQKEKKGLKCKDLKQWLYNLLAARYDATNPRFQHGIALDFIEKDIDN